MTKHLNKYDQLKEETHKKMKTSIGDYIIYSLAGIAGIGTLVNFGYSLYQMYNNYKTQIDWLIGW